jgi:V/A-type H+-transporting ATPase subunit I
LLKAQRLFQDIDEVIRSLGVPLETGVMATMFKGAPKEKTDYVIEDIQDFIADLEEKSKALLDEPKKILAEQDRVSKQLEEYSNIEAALKMAANLNIDLTSFARLKIFYADIFVIDSKDEAEIRKSISDLQLYTSKLSEEKTSMVVIGSREDSERIIKVMRSFGVHPLQIPANMPQNPSGAHSQAQAKVKELEAKSNEITKNVEKTKQAVLSKILSLHEAARVAKDVLEITRKPGGTENFALIQGYIPYKMEEKFKKLTSDYVSIIENAQFDQHVEAA